VKALKALKRGAEEQLQDAATTFGAQLQAAEAELEQAQAKMDGELQAAMQKIAELESGHKKDNLDHQMKRMASDELDLLAYTRVAELGGELEAAKERIGELELLLEAKALEVTSVPSPLEKESTTAQQQRARPLSIQVRPAAGVLDDSRGLRRQRRRRSSVVSMQMEGAAQLPQIRAASEPPPVTQAQMQPKAQAPLQVVKLPGSQREREQRIAELATNRIRDLEVALAEAGTREKRIGTLARKRIGQLEAALTDSGLGQLASDAVGLMGKLQDDNRVAELEQTQAAMEGELEAATQQIAELEAARGELGVEVEALIAADVMNRELVHNLSSRYQDQLQTSLFEASAAREQTSAVGSPTAETDLLIQVVGQLQQQVLQHQAEATSKQEELSRAHEQIEIWEGVVSNLTSQCGSEPLRTALDDRQDVMLAESAPAIIRADEHIQRLMPYPAESSRHSRRAAFLAKHKLSASVGGEPNDSLQMPQTVKTGGDLTPFESSFSALELVRSSRISCVETCLKLMQ
jgi:hypothetical protein